MRHGKPFAGADGLRFGAEEFPPRFAQREPLGAREIGAAAVAFGKLEHDLKTVEREVVEVLVRQPIAPTLEEIEPAAKRPRRVRGGTKEPFVRLGADDIE